MGRSGKAMRHVMVAVLFATLLVSTIGPVALHAAGPYVVNSIADDDDASAGDGLCMTALNECTLRAAIQQANADGAATTIFRLLRFRCTHDHDDASAGLPHRHRTPHH